MNIVLVGIQGSGKGTQARLIQEKYSYDFFEMGQKLRNFSSFPLKESEEVKKCLEEGKLVPIELTGKILTHYIDTHKNGYILFDGIPRSIDQKEMFDLIVKDYIIIFLDLKKEDAILRLAGRKIDPITGESFSSDFKGDINPKTGNKLIIRSDDKPEAVAKRVDIFYQNTLPLLATWGKERKNIYTIDAKKSIEDVFLEISNIIDNFYKS